MDNKTLEKFKELYGKLLAHDLQKRLDGEVREFDKLDAMFLIRTGSCLAFGSPIGDEIEDAQWKLWAYDVATRLALDKEKVDPHFSNAAKVILARLGNFPGIHYLGKVLPNTVDAKYPHALALEIITREDENTVPFSGLGCKTLTDFQIKMVDSLHRSRCVSISAPTSAGKSYIFSLDIVNALSSRAAKVIVYIVPTRALIRQVMRDLLICIREAGLTKIAVSSAPTPLEPEQMGEGVVFVLTQERLMSLLYSPEGRVNLDMIYIDEAQEIGDSDRGMLLHSSIREVLKRFPNIQISFSSPQTSNPDLLLEEFEIESGGEFLLEQHAAVSQMVVALDKVPRKRKEVDVSVVAPTGKLKVQRIKVEFEFTGIRTRLAEIAKQLTSENETSIIYANRAADSVAIALKLAKIISDVTDDEEVNNLCHFVKTHIHSKYALVDTLPKRVAFHYGKMPHLIRAQVENLLKSKKIKYVVCTTTLLQGVNLPAKNIFILSPRKGIGHAMSSGDFWNLAGRAGRLLETFSGTVWCIEPDTWDEKPLEGERLFEMKSSFRDSLADEDLCNKLSEIIDKPDSLNKTKDKDHVEQVLGKIFSEFTCNGLDVAKSRYADKDSQNRLVEIDTKCKKLRSDLEVPTEVCERNTTVSPICLNKLWVGFRKRNDIISQYLPLDPRTAASLDRIRRIFYTIDQVFIHSGNNSWRYHASLAYHWVRGKTLKDLIKNHLDYHNIPNTSKDTNEAIRRFLEDLESNVRFKYVKYLKAYIDTLSNYLTQTNQDNLAQKISPLHLYIEFGAGDRVLVMLMSLGLSRTTAIFVRDAITREDIIGRAECWSRLARLNLDRLNIPAICKKEIGQLIGK